MMKKSLLLAVAAMAFAGANAQPAFAPRAKQAKKVSVSAQKSQIDLGAAQMEVAEKATAATRAKKVKAAAAPKAYYYRPDGMFYANWDATGAGYYMPYLFGKPYATYTWANASSPADAAANWTYILYNASAQKHDTLTTTEKDLTMKCGYELEMCPTLEVSNDGGNGSFVLQGGKWNGTSISNGPFDCRWYTTQYSGEPFVADGEELAELLVSPHYYGSSNRYINEQYGWTYYSGAKDEDGGRTGYWFGKNAAGWNTMGIALEKPTEPYLLTNVYVYYTALEATGDANITAKVYKLPKMYEYNDTANVDVDVTLLNAENLIAQGSVTVNADSDANGILTIPMMEEEDGLQYEVTPEIDCPILVVISGYDDANISKFSMLVTKDAEDEGKGELAFMGHNEAGEVSALYGLNNFFTSGEMKVGASIFVGVQNPFLIFKYTFEDGEYEFPAEGGKLSKSPVAGYDFPYISFYTTSGSEEWIYDAPEWLTIELADIEEDGEFSGEVQATVTAAALPAGTTYREAKVRFGFPGAKCEYLFTQGTKPQGVKGDLNGDGQVNSADVSALVNMLLEGSTDSAADINGDGEINAADASALVNIILAAAE